MNIQEQIAILKGIPKTEIHLHLEGLASRKTIWSLIKKGSLDIGINSKEELDKRFHIHNLNEFVDLFINVIQNSIQHEEDLDFLLKDTQEYLLENNIRYAEIFYSPTKLTRNGIPYQQIIQHLTEGASRIEAETGCVIRYLTDVSRSFGPKNAMLNLKNHLKYSTDAFIGIGLGGSEEQYGAQEFRNIFRKAVSAGCTIVAHAGEDSGPRAIWDVLNYLGVQRVGHGISAAQDSALIDYLRQQQTVMEICPTSNLYTRKYAKSLDTHPIRYFFDQGLYVTVNSDDPTPFSTSLNSEYCRLLESRIFDLQELIVLIKNGIYGTFLPTKKQDAIWREAEQYLIEHKVEIPIAKNHLNLTEGA